MTDPSTDQQAAAGGLAAEEYAAVMARSYREFAAGEGWPEPVRAYRFDGPPLTGTGPDAAAGRVERSVSVRRPRGERSVLDDRTAMTRDQVRSLLLAHAVAGRVVADPDGTRAVARNNLRRLRASGSGGRAVVWLDEWDRLLDGPLVELLIALTSPSQWSRELRQNSPWAGVLTAEERQRVLAVHRRTASGQKG